MLYEGCAAVEVARQTTASSKVLDVRLILLPAPRYCWIVSRPARFDLGILDNSECNAVAAQGKTQEVYGKNRSSRTMEEGSRLLFQISRFSTKWLEGNIKLANKETSQPQESKTRPACDPIHIWSNFLCSLQPTFPRQICVIWLQFERVIASESASKATSRRRVSSNSSA